MAPVRAIRMIIFQDKTINLWNPSRFSTEFWNKIPRNFPDSNTFFLTKYSQKPLSFSTICVKNQWFMPSSHLNFWSGDQNFKRLSADLPSPTLSNRATTRNHIKNMHSWSLVGTLLFGVGRPSAVHRPTIGRHFGSRATIDRWSDDRSPTEIHIIYMLIT